MTYEEVKEFAAIYHHKFLVHKHLILFIQDLIKRTEEHDNSKFSEEEFPLIIQAISEIRSNKYGTPEYEEVKKKWQFAFDIHYKKNRHHPEFHPNGIEDMTLVDLLEMLADWKAASSRDNEGNVQKSIQFNIERFKLSPQLVKILENTVREYKL